MKKFISLSLLALAAILGLFAMQKASQTHATALVGEETLLFIHFPDIRQSRAHWKSTALHQIAHEPEVVDFLQKPKTQLPKSGSGRSYLRDLVLADPREAFFALNSLSLSNKAPSLGPESISKTPGFVAGALCMGDKGRVESVLAEGGKELQRAWPNGRKGRVRHDGVDIETFTHNQTTVASAWVGRWILVGDDLDLINATIDRAQGNHTGGLLKDHPAFLKSLAHMPNKGELLAFVQPQAIALLAAGGSHGSAISGRSLEDLKQIEAVCMGVKFDGENIRDAVFALMSPDSVKTTTGQPLSRQSLALTTKDTLFYYAGVMDLKRVADKMAQLPTSPVGLPSAITELQAGLANQGVTLDNVAAMLGTEFAVILDWPAESVRPSFLVSLDVRDTATTTKTVDLLTSGQLGNTAWKHTQNDGAELFSLSAVPMLAPTLAIKDNKLIFGLDGPRVAEAISTAKDSKGGLEETQSFIETEKLVLKPTHAFGYVDSKELFERIYSASRPLIMLWGGFNPAVRNTIDVHKLPATESISKHLHPIAYSSASLPDGFLAESVGPVTFTQSVIGVGIGVGAALIPMARNYVPAKEPKVKASAVQATP